MSFHNALIVGENIDPAVYVKQDVRRGHPDYVMSRSELMEFARNPRRWLAGYREGGSPETEWGSLMDALLLCPTEVSKRFAVAPAMYPCEPTKKDPRTEKPWTYQATHCKAWRDEQEVAGLAVVSSDDMSQAVIACGVLMGDPNIRELVRCSQKQVMVTGEYRDDETGILVSVKTLIDLVPDRSHRQFGKALADFKTGASVSPESWAKSVFNFDYDAQAGLFLDLYVAATGEHRTDWLHPSQENFPPYEVSSPIPMLSPEFVEIGRSKYQAALKAYARCLATNEWPGYSVGGRVEMHGCYIIEPEAYMILRLVERGASPYKDPEWMTDKVSTEGITP